MTPVATSELCDSGELDCFTITEPTKLILVGNATATILYAGQSIGQLSPKDRIFETCLNGEYCINWGKNCCTTASVYICDCDVCEDLFMTVIDNGNGTATATNVDGTTVVWDVSNSFTTITDNGDGTITAINTNGTPITWDKNDTFTTITDNGNGTVTGVNVNGSIVTWSKTDTNTFVTITDNGDGTVTGVNVNGITVSWSKTDTFSTTVDNGDGTFTTTNANGVPVTWVGTDENDFMTVINNGDGTYQAQNVNGPLVMWDGRPSLFADGYGTYIEGLGDDDEPFTVNIDLCALNFLDPEFEEGLGPITIAACIDGDTWKIPLVIPDEVLLTPVVEGDGVNITGGTGPEDPYIVNADLCDLRVITLPEIEAALDIKVAGCVDGESVLLPYDVTYPGPTGVIQWSDISDCSATTITMFGTSDPDCNEPGITFLNWWITDANNAVIEGVNIVADPQFPLIVTVDVCAAVFPLTANLLVTDPCGQGGDASGNGLPATDVLIKDLPIASISIPSTISDSGSVVLNASGSTPSDGVPGGQACANITNYEYTILNELGAVVAVITTGATGSVVNSVTHPLITGGTAQSPIVNLDTIAGQTITVQLLVTDCNGQAGRDANADGIGDEGVPAIDTGYLVLCESLQIRDSSLDIASEIFTEDDFSAYTVTTPLKVFDTVATGNGSLGGSISATVNLGTHEGLLATGNSRIRVDGTSAVDGQISVTFNRDICVLHLEAFDVDPAENLSSFGPGTLDSITPPFGNEVSSNVVLVDIQSNVVTFIFSPDPAFSFVLDINRIETCAVISPCFDATKCTAENGTVTYTRDSNGATVPNVNVVEC